MGTPRKRPIRVKKPPPPPTKRKAQPWDPADFPARGDQSEDDLFIEIGRALTEWERFEGRLSWIYAALVTGHVGEPPLAALHAYGTILSFQGRYEMVLAAAQCYLAENPASVAVAGLLPILKRAKNFSPRRNEIAHGAVQPFWNEEAIRRMQVDMDDETEYDGFALMPSSYSSRSNELAKAGLGDPEEFLVYRHPSYAYTSGIIARYREAFMDLFKSVNDQWWRINHELWLAKHASSP